MNNFESVKGGSEIDMSFVGSPLTPEQLIAQAEAVKSRVPFSQGHDFSNRVTLREDAQVKAGEIAAVRKSIEEEFGKAA